MSETFKGRWTIEMPDREPIKLPDGSVVVLSPVRVADIPVRFYWLLAYPACWEGV